MACMIADQVQVIKKPEWISWDDIHNVLVQAHAENRQKGIIMRKPGLPGEMIEKEIGDNGVMLVALYGNKLVGTSALIVKRANTWYSDGPYGYLCFDAVLPQYVGKGVYSQLCRRRELLARDLGLNKLYSDTHHKNYHIIAINKSHGFKCVDVKVLSDHWNVVLFKWLDGCPHSNFRCKYEYMIRRAKMQTKLFLKQIIKWGGRG